MDVDQLVTVEIDGIRVCFSADDLTLKYTLEDPRAMVVTDRIIPTVHHDIDINTFAEGFGAEPFSVMMTHLWRQSMDFAYLDVGANSGLTVGCIASFIRHCGRTPTIYGFEPGTAFRSLTSTITANGLDRCAKVYRLAMSDQKGSMVFHQIAKNSAAGSLLPEISSRAAIGAMSEIVVEVTSIDAFVRENEIDGPLVVKIDTEGNDLRVIAGSAATRAQRPVLMVAEFTPSLCRNYCDPIAELTKLGQDNIILDAGVRGSPISDFATYISSIDLCSDIIIVPKNLPNVDDLVRRLSLRP